MDCNLQVPLSMGFLRQDYWSGLPSRRSSWPRDWTHVSCIGRWILCCWTYREATLFGYLGPYLIQQFFTDGFQMPSNTHVPDCWHDYPGGRGTPWPHSALHVGQCQMIQTGSSNLMNWRKRTVRYPWTKAGLPKPLETLLTEKGDPGESLATSGHSCICEGWDGPSTPHDMH